MLKYIFLFVTLGIIAVITWLLLLYSNIKLDVQKIVNYNPPKTTQFFDKNGNLVANIFKNEHRLYVKYKDIPARIIEALVAIEDTQFFEHNGINLDAISRALIKDIKARAFVEGASTLTQQLVRGLVLNREKKIIRKIKEVLLAIKVETVLSKEEILERYFNQIYFGHGYYGIKTASLGYFKKNLYELNLKEIAILVGLPRAPSFYNPTKNLKFALARANQVITRLHTLGWINQDEYENSIKLNPTVYKQTLTQNKAPYVIDYALKVLKKDIEDIKTGGYLINLTIDLDAQNIAKEALKISYNNILKRDEKLQKNAFNNVIKDDKKVEENYFIEKLNASMISIENKTGAILALVGGIDYKKSSFNRVVQSKRQPGSAAKPFIYQTALDLGYSPASQLTDIGRTYEYKINNEIKKWQPKNYGGKFNGIITLREALVYSKNLATINLVNEIGMNEIYKGLELFGIRNIPRDLSLALGTFSISPLDLSKAYSVLSNNGIQVTPYIVSSIIDKNSELIVFEPQTKYINSPEQIYLMTSILKDGVKRGTGKRARIKGMEAAGKTGTTNDNVDVWFCGFTPSMQTIIWFGNDDNRQMRKSETGGKTAAPVFSYFNSKYLELHPEIERKFEKPKNVKISMMNNKKEYYTDISKIPEVQIPISNNENTIEF